MLVGFSPAQSYLIPLTLFARICMVKKCRPNMIGLKCQYSLTSTLSTTWYITGSYMIKLYIPIMLFALINIIRTGHWTDDFLLQMNLGTTASMTSNGRQAAEGPRQSSQSAGQSHQQAVGQSPSLLSNGTTRQQGQGGPRVIRITHQTMEPVVMMQMNIDGMCAAMLS